MSEDRCAIMRSCAAPGSAPADGGTCAAAAGFWWITSARHLASSSGPPCISSTLSLAAPNEPSSASMESTAADAPLW
jgi:hypothetical protein